jgi:hypothetical protein
MTHLIWSSVFFALFMLGHLFAEHDAEPGTVRILAGICSLACLTLAFVSLGLFIWPIVFGGF